MVKNNKYNEIDLVRKEFGMSVTDQLATVEARVLPPPLVIFSTPFFYCFFLLLYKFSFQCWSLRGSISVYS